MVLEIAYSSGARPYHAVGHDSRLSQVIVNLLDNAISFSPPGGRVTVAARRVGHEIQIAVEDEGRSKPARPLFQGAGDLGKLRGFFVAKAGPETHAPPSGRHFDDRTDAVVLRFVDELRILEGRVGERGEHGLQHVVGIPCQLSKLITSFLQSVEYRSLNHGSAEFE